MSCMPVSRVSCLTLCGNEVSVLHLDAEVTADDGDRCGMEGRCDMEDEDRCDMEDDNGRCDFEWCGTEDGNRCGAEGRCDMEDEDRCGAEDRCDMEDDDETCDIECCGTEEDGDRCGADDEGQCGTEDFEKLADNDFFEEKERAGLRVPAFETCKL